MDALRQKRRSAWKHCCARPSLLTSFPSALSFGATTASHSASDSGVSPDVAREDLQHCCNRTQRSVAAAAAGTALRFPSVKKTTKMMLLCGALCIYTVMLGTHHAAAQRHTPKGSPSSDGNILTTDSVSSINQTWDSRSIHSVFNHSGNTGRNKYRPIRVKHTVPPDRHDDLLDGRGVSFLGTNPVAQRGASVDQQSTNQDTQRDLAASSMAVAGSWRKLQPISNHVGEHRSLSSVRDEEAEEAAAPHMVSGPNREDTAASLSQPSFLHTATVPTAAQLFSVPPPGGALSAENSVSFTPPQVNQASTATPLAFPSTAVPLARQLPKASLASVGTTSAEAMPVVTPTIATPAGAARAVATLPAVPGLIGAVPTTTTSSTLLAPETAAATEGPTAPPGAALTAMAPVTVITSEPERAGQPLPLPSSTGATPPATGDTTLPAAAVPTVVSGGGRFPVQGVVIGQPQAFAPQPLPVEVPLLPTSGQPSVTASTRNPAVVVVPVTSTGQNVAPFDLGAAPLLSATVRTGATEAAVGANLQGEGLPQQLQEGRIQPQQPQVVTGEMLREVQPHGVQQHQVQQVGEKTAETTGKGEPYLLVYDRGNRVGVASAPLHPASRGDTRRVCFDACECWPVWASSIAAFVIYSAATLVAVLMTASLFSKGLRSSNFYKGGGYWLLGAAAAGGATGALIGALVAHCVGAALGLAAGMMCLAASLVLVGRRGAWLGALGGVMTGGVIGAMIDGGATPIALGAGIGLLLGVICGFVPLARQLKMNERYIRRGIAQGAATSSPASSRTAVKRPISRTATSRVPKEQYGHSLEPERSSSEDVRSLAVQRLSSNPISRIRSNMGLAAATALPADRYRSLGTDAGPLVVAVPGAARDTETATTASVSNSALVGRSISGSLREHSDAI